MLFDVSQANRSKFSRSMLKGSNCRWAVEKGFLDKNTHEWNEERGGLEGYLEERNQRMLLRCKFNHSRWCVVHLST